MNTLIDLTPEPDDTRPPFGTASTQPLIDAGALRQLRHNDGSEGFVFAYDKVITDRVFALMERAASLQGTRARDWPEDSSQENGNYENACRVCTNHFIGNKHRRVCKICAAFEAELAKEAVQDIEAAVDVEFPPQVNQEMATKLRHYAERIAFRKGWQASLNVLASRMPADRIDAQAKPTTGISEKEMMARRIHNLKRHIEDFCKPSHLAAERDARIEALIAEIRAAKTLAFRDSLFENLVEVFEDTILPTTETDVQDSARFRALAQVVTKDSNADFVFVTGIEFCYKTTTESFGAFADHLIDQQKEIT